MAVRRDVSAMALSWQRILLVFLGCYSLFLNTRVCGDLFASISGLESLLETEREAVMVINQYVELELERLDRLKQLSQRPDLRVLPTSIEGLEFAAVNAIDAFRAVKNIVVDQTSVFGQLRHNSAEDILAHFPANDMAMPSEDDLNGATVALLRLQDTYLLEPTDIADGKIRNSKVYSRMTADDCFLVGYNCAMRDDWYHSVQWLLISLDRYWDESRQHSTYLTTFNLTVVYDYLAFGLHQTGNAEQATYYSRKLNEIDPTYPGALHLPIYEELLRSKLNHTNSSFNLLEPLPPVYNERPTDHGVFLKYEALCRGTSYLNASESSKLNCYLKRNNAFLFLAPIKVEVMYLSPLVLLFHEVMSEEEQQQLRDIASPLLQRAMVVNDHKQSPDEDNNVAANYRVAKNAWLSDSLYPLVARVSRRVTDMTDLSVESSETLQMANYGLGGHYEPHYDMALENQRLELNGDEHGNRLATILFYLSQPEIGGGTIFEDLGIGVHPTNRGALFWHNLHRDGRPDMRTRHAGCPVLLGRKWVANKWLHEVGNEFTRSCTLTPDSYT